MEVSERGSESETCVELVVDEIMTLNIVQVQYGQRNYSVLCRSTVREGPYIGHLSLNM
jgi:hypothetical protein